MTAYCTMLSTGHMSQICWLANAHFACPTSHHRPTNGHKPGFVAADVPLQADLEDEFVIPLPNVTGKILAKVIEYCKKHVDAKAKDGDAKSSTSDEELKTWDTEFVKVLDQSTLFELILVRCLQSDDPHLESKLKA